MRQKHLGQIVREAREKAGLSQEELAQRVGLTQGALSFIERGVVEPRLSILLRLFDALGLSKKVLKNREAPHA
jgi:transcriptional regulator with XRE-family HTH domain